MLLSAVPSLLLASTSLLALGVSGSESINANGSAQGAPAPAAAPQEKKDVPATAADPIDMIKKFIAEQKIDTKAANWKTKLPKPPQLTFDPKKTYTWVMETSKGTMKFQLMPNIAPMHVSSCIYLNTVGFYDGLKFHRVLKGFMAQGGDAIGTGGGPFGYQMRVEIKSEVKHNKAGILSTARRSGDLNSDGSQFFIMFAANAGLDGEYTIYGDMTDGLETLKKIEAIGAARDPQPPTEIVTITKGTIEVADAK